MSLLPDFAANIDTTWLFACAALLIGWLVGRWSVLSALARSRVEREILQNELLRSQQNEKLISDRLEDFRVKELDLTASNAAFLARIEEHEKGELERERLLRESQLAVSDNIRALSAQALRENSETFLTMARETFTQQQEQYQLRLVSQHNEARQLIDPLSQSLNKLDEKLAQLETKRVEAYSGLYEQFKLQSEVLGGLSKETGRLVQALKTPAVRGRWGEIQLRRVVELAGMLPYCDFDSQVSIGERLLRPDMVIRLPNQRNIVVDAKAPLDAYLHAVEIEEENAKLDYLARHAKQVRGHLQSLGSKRYWEQFSDSPEFVILFLPSEVLFTAALERDVELLEFGVKQKVLLATPLSLIGLLKTVAYGWQEDQLTRHAAVIRGLGQELSGRLSTLSGYFEDLRKGLERAVGAYNRAAGAYESRVLVTARRFEELGVPQTATLEPVSTVEVSPRELSVLDGT